jgi:hypothetical protein
MAKPERAIVWNDGGGTQSAAIAVLIAEGRLPRPEVAVIADTGREDPATWAYLRDYIQPMLLSSVGLTVQIAPRSLAKVDLYSHRGTLLLPVFTATGKFQTYCSEEWKAMVVRRFLRGLGYGPERPVTQWIGYSTNEVLRIKASRTQWTKLRWPLIYDVPLSRDECVELVLSAGLPPPPKSSCYMCPHRNNAQWRDLKENRPTAWAQAVALDEEVRARDAQGSVYLHRSLVPLAKADLSDPPTPESTQGHLLDLVDDCGSGYCFV